MRIPVLGIRGAGLVGVLLWILQLQSPAEAGAWRPELVGGSISGGWEDRPVRASSGVVDPDLGTGDGRFWFAPTEDVEGRVQLWSRWRFGDSKLRLTYERRDWADGQIFSRQAWSVDLRQKLGRKLGLKVGAEYSPRVYLRHRSDKDALPGTPRFRPETYRGYEFGAALSLTRGRITASALGEFELRDENDWFNERDRRAWGAGAELDYRQSAGPRLRPFYIRTVTTTENEPDLGTDRSHRAHEWGLRVAHSVGAVALTGYGKIAFRTYTTDDPEDTSRFGRKDTIHYLSGRVAWSRGGWWTPFLSLELAGRDVHKVSVDPAELSDDGVADRSLIRLGLDFEHALGR